MSIGKDRRQQIWDILRQHKREFVSTHVLAGKTGMNPKNTAALMAAWEKAGCVEAVKQKDVFTGKYAKTWRLLKDEGVDAPRVDRHGRRLPETLGNVMWRTMKILKRFTVAELEQHVRMSRDTGSSTVRHYAALLAQAGYLRNTGTRQHPHYVLLKNTGSKAPQVWRVTEIYDPNTRETVYREERNHDD